MEINYKKKFIILKNKYSNIKGYRPKGHIKLEIKGVHTNINVNIENAEADTAYTLTLVTEEVIELGKIYTDAYGRTRSELILSTEDFLQGELEQGAVLVHRDKEVLLGEYMDRDDGRIEEYIESLNYKESQSEAEPETTEAPEIEEVAEAEEVAEVEEVVEIADEPELVDEAEIKEETVYEEDPETFEVEEYEPEEYALEEYELQEDFIENLNSGYEEELQEIGEVEDFIEAETEEVGQERYVDLEHEYNVKKMEQTTDYVLSILRYFPYAEPFKEELNDHNWWKIDYNWEMEEGFLPYFDYIAGKSSTDLMKKYGHYLFGLFNEGENVKYYIFGVPGEFTLEEHPNSGEPGFETWFEGAEEVGYWLLYIDPLTGRVVEPS